MTKNNLKIIFNEIFQISLSGYLIFIVIELLKEGFITNFFNINFLLLTVVVSGIGMSILGPIKDTENRKITENDYFIAGLFALFSGGIVYFKTTELGSIGIVISVISSVLVFLLSYLVIFEKE